MKHNRQKGLLIVFLLLGAALTFSGLLFFKQKPTDSTVVKPAKATVYMGWLYSGAYSGEVLAAREQASKNNLEITLSPGGPGLDPIRRVRDGTFGIAAADEVVRVIEKGSPLVIIGVLNDEAPAAFAALKTSGIRTPKDFVGKRVGILPFGSTGLIYQSLLAREGIDRSRITEVTVSADLRPFLLGSTHDVQPVYAYDEPVSLDAQNVEYVLIKPAEYGVRFKGPVYFTTRHTVENDPELVERFLRSSIDGWSAAAADPERAIQSLVAQDPSLKHDRELQVLKRALPYYLGSKGAFLDSDLDSWQPMIDDMVRFSVLPRAIDYRTFVDLSFVRSIHKSRGGAKP